MRHLFRNDRWPGLRFGKLRRLVGRDCGEFTGGAFRRSPNVAVIRVVLPAHLRTLAQVDGDVQLDVGSPTTQGALLDALEGRYPVLRGTIREHVTHKRRPFVRFFACERDLSHDPADAPLPEAVCSGSEPFYIVGAIAGG